MEKSQYIFHPWLPKGQIHVFAGSSGAGKTTLLFQILNELRKGEDFLQLSTFVNKVPFLYVASDRSVQAYEELFSRLDVETFPILSLVDLKAKQISNNDFKIPFSLASQPLNYWLSYLTDIIKVMNPRPELLVFDTALDLLPIRNFNDQRSVMEGMTSTAGWCIANEVAIIGTSHTNKLKQNEDFVNPFNRISGSHGLLGYASSKLLLIPELEANDKVPRLHLQGQHFADTVIALRRGEKGKIELAPTGVSDGALSIIALVQNKRTFGLKDLLPLGLSRSTIYRLLMELEENELVAAVERGKWAVI